MEAMAAVRGPPHQVALPVRVRQTAGAAARARARTTATRAPSVATVRHVPAPVVRREASTEAAGTSAVAVPPAAPARREPRARCPTPRMEPLGSVEPMAPTARPEAPVA